MSKNIILHSEIKIGEFSKDDLGVKFIGTINPNSSDCVCLVFEVIEGNGASRIDEIDSSSTDYIMGLVHKKFNYCQIGKQTKEVQDFIAETYYFMIK